MTWLASLLLTLAAPADGADQQPIKAPRSARVAVTAEIACLHCTFGQGDHCAACLKIDAKTPVVLAGKSAKALEKVRLSKKVVVATGALSVKDKRLVLTSDDAHVQTAADKKAPAKGLARVEGVPVCGSCDLMLCDECTLAVANGATPIIFDGKLARQHVEGARAITAVGRLFVDQRGLLRLDATKVDLVKGK